MSDYNATDRYYIESNTQLFQFYDKYSRFNWSLERRETWEESVDRSVSFLIELSQNKLPQKDYVDIRNAMLNRDAFPSMRLFATAGEAARRDHSVLYNCSFISIDSLDSIAEVLALAMSGVGVGYSVEKRFVDKLPPVKYQYIMDPIYNFIIEDTTEGWLDAFSFGLDSWFNGEDAVYDYSQLRSVGAPLKIKGGRASGYEPIKDLLDFTRTIILNAVGRKLSTVEVHDIVTKIGDVGMSGAIRRAALLALFDFDDLEMRNCKAGNFWDTSPWRMNANNSAVWPNQKLTRKEIQLVLDNMFDGETGEPGIFRRINAVNTAPKNRDIAKLKDVGLNPCAEIYLRPQQFCNLSSAIARKTDTYEDLMNKIRIATIIGTIQSMATNFPNLRPIWKENCEEERLLGVDINGILDAEHLMTEKNLREFRDYAVFVNKLYAGVLGINQSASVTCVKPSGNSSLLFDTSAGIHARWSEYYIRRFRIEKSSPLYAVLNASGIELVPAVGQDSQTATTYVFGLPVAAPEGSVTNGERGAIEQLEFWKLIKLNWTTHNPSCTITYRAHEKELIIDWVYKNQDIIGGISFLPYNDHIYKQAPYEAITKEEYDYLVATTPGIMFGLLSSYEDTDHTTAGQELACFAGGVCEL